MVFLKLLGNAIGSIVMYWGVLLPLLLVFFLAFFLEWLLNWLWNRLTGHQDEWNWTINTTQTLEKAIAHYQLQWLGWIPGIVVQIWFAGYAAGLVQASSMDVSTLWFYALHLAGILSMVLAIAIFYWVYAQLIDFRAERWIYGLLGSLTLGAYFSLLGQPAIATWLRTSWSQVLAIVFQAFLENL